MSTWHDAGPCTWLVERPNPLLTDDAALDAGWYPESPADMVVVVECGAPSQEDDEGRFRCQHGHERGTLEEELAPGGNEWVREQYDRYEETGSYRR